MVGGAYCPLSPRDPEQRLGALLEQTQSPLVLLHWMTRGKFKHDTVTFDIAAAVTEKETVNHKDLDRLSTVKVTSENIAYVIFTSGSTGMPKAVSFFTR